MGFKFIRDFIRKTTFDTFPRKKLVILLRNIDSNMHSNLIEVFKFEIKFQLFSVSSQFLVTQCCHSEGEGANCFFSLTSTSC